MVCDGNGAGVPETRQKHLEWSGTAGLGSHPGQVRPASQALLLVPGRQGLRCRASTPVMQPLPDVARVSDANHEVHKPKCRDAPAVRQPEIPATEHHRADVRLAEGGPEDRYLLRQAGKRFCHGGHTGLHVAVSAAVLFVHLGSLD